VWDGNDFDDDDLPVWDGNDFDDDNYGKGKRYLSKIKGLAFGGKPRMEKDQKGPRSTENSRSNFAAEKNRDLFDDDDLPVWDGNDFDDDDLPVWDGNDFDDDNYGKGISKFRDGKKKASRFGRRRNKVFQW